MLAYLRAISATSTFARFSCWFLLAAGCGGPGGESEPATEPLSATRGVVLISIDTLRADHLGCYGYSRDTSPFIDSLAARGVLFEHAFAPLPGTLPSHMSMLTGYYPPEHGVYPPNGVLSPEIEMLPELFQRSGFRTGGFTENGYVAGRYGFDRGFDVFDDHIESSYDDVERTVARALDFLRGLQPEDRFFLFLHTYAVHDPYEPPEPYASQFGSPRPPDAFAPTGPNLIAFNRGKGEISAAALAHYRSAYDASIRYVDDVFAGFFDELHILGLDRDLTVLLTSDHGEEFLEHGKMVHEQIYRETMHVPLIILHPQVTPRRVSSVVEGIDVTPTLLALAGLEPLEGISGRSLVDLLLGGERPPGAEAYGESFDRRGRTLFRDVDDALYQYLEIEPEADRRGPWVTKQIEFDADKGPLRLQALSYHQPRQLQILVGGENRPAVQLIPHRWRSFEIELPPAVGRTRITLATDGCVSPREVGASGDPRCLSFRVRGAPLRRIELYDIHNDPLAAQDLSQAAPELTSESAERLRRYRLQTVAPAESLELDDELERRLKQLGYLQ